MGDDELVGMDQFAEEFSFVVRASGHTETRGAEVGTGRGGLCEAFAHHAPEFDSGFGCRNVIAGAGGGPANDFAVFIADNCYGARLASVYSEKEFAHKIR
jgi:hypothetical protein